MAIQPIPMPEVLDADRHFYRDQKEFGNNGETEADHIETLDKALHAAGEYGAHLWELLGRVRAYLYEVATSGGVGREPERAEQDWLAWARTYASVTSALAGPTGDNGLAWSEAVLIARDQHVELPADPITM